MFNQNTNFLITTPKLHSCLPPALYHLFEAETVTTANFIKGVPHATLFFELINLLIYMIDNWYEFIGGEQD